MAKSKPADIAKKLRANSQDKNKQISQMREQLTIIDAIIDEYDEVIDRVDPKTIPLTQEINTSIQAVANAYNARITAGCRNNLVWQKQETKKWKFGITFNDVETWKVVKDPSLYRDIGFYGVKYYRKPQNREYGANLVTEIIDASIDVNTKVLAVFDAGTTGLVGIQTGDYVTDDLDEPQVWPSGNLPTVVGVGTTTYYASTFIFTGFCTAFDNKVYSDGSVGILTSAKIGDRVVYPDAPIFQSGTTITGFGTAVYARQYVDASGITTTVNITIDYATLNQNTIGGGTSLSFQVGIVSTFSAIFLSTTTSVGAAHSAFVVVRPPDTTDVVFESTKNPIDPIEIGIVKGGSKTGRGHEIKLINNKQPDVVARWRQVMQEPEPDVGAGKAEYYIGNTAWPTITTCVDSGGTPICNTTYAPEGTTVSIAIGSTIPQAQLGTTSVSPLNPGNCATLDANIASAEATMNAKISANVPKINYYIDGAEGLRELRDEQETQAWSMLQGIAFLQEQQKKLNSHANNIEQYNWKEFGY